MYDISTFILFAILGVLGGFTHILIDAETWEDLKRFSSLKTIIIGSIVGILYAFLYSDHAFPNSVMSFAAGYTGTDFIEGIIKKFRKKENGE